MKQHSGEGRRVPPRPEGTGFPAPDSVIEYAPNGQAHSAVGKGVRTRAGVAAGVSSGECVAARRRAASGFFGTCDTQDTAIWSASGELGGEHGGFSQRSV